MQIQNLASRRERRYRRTILSRTPGRQMYAQRLRRGWLKRQHHHCSYKRGLETRRFIPERKNRQAASVKNFLNFDQQLEKIVIDRATNRRVWNRSCIQVFIVISIRIPSGETVEKSAGDRKKNKQKQRSKMLPEVQS